MEDVLDVYKRPYNEKKPVVCMPIFDLPPPRTRRFSEKSQKKIEIKNLTI
jgi:hypothetical protein